jgi:hypothetical protein
VIHRAAKAPTVRLAEPTGADPTPAEPTGRHQRSPIGEPLFRAFSPPDTALTFDQLAQIAVEHHTDMAEAVRWLNVAIAGGVVAQGSDDGPQTYVLTDHGRDIAVNDRRR